MSEYKIKKCDVCGFEKAATSDGGKEFRTFTLSLGASSYSAPLKSVDVCEECQKRMGIYELFRRNIPEKEREATLAEKLEELITEIAWEAASQTNK